jgi:protein involved in polysaccharide export with SLBB domain
VVRTADYLSFLRLGEVDHNPALQEGITVYVPSRRDQCAVMGEVWRGGNYEILPDETVADMVELAGGYTPRARIDRLVLERLGQNEVLTVSEFGDDVAASTPVQGRDVVVVPDRDSFPGTDFVRISGGGGRDGIVYLEQGETIASFLPRFTRLQRTHDLSRAVVERKNAAGEIDYIPVDLEAVIQGTGDGSLELMPGDVINIPSYETAVYVVGEVPQPGPIPFQRGLPAERYIALAGGPGSAGSIDRIEIISPDGSKRGGDRNSTVYRGETIVVKTKRSRIFQAVFVSVTSLTSLVLSIIAVSRN